MNPNANMRTAAISSLLVVLQIQKRTNEGLKAKKNPRERPFINPSSRRKNGVIKACRETEIENLPPLDTAVTIYESQALLSFRFASRIPHQQAQERVLQ